MIGMDQVKEMVLNTLMTGRLKNGYIVSLILLATPESGKTSVVNSVNSKNLAVYTDITGKGLLDTIKTHSELSHIVLNDLTIASAHSKKASAYFFAILGAATEEGIKSVADPGGTSNYDMRRGAIICTTIDFIHDKRRTWMKNGLSSRFLPFCFSHSAKLQLKVLESINGHDKAIELKPAETIMPSSMIEVKITRDLLFQCERMALIVAKENQELGYRRKKQFMSLVMGRALRKTWKNPCVNKSDIEWLESIQKFISWENAHEI